MPLISVVNCSNIFAIPDVKVHVKTPLLFFLIPQVA